MRKRPLLLRAAAATLSLVSAATTAASERHVPGRILVQFREDAPAEQVRTLVYRAGARFGGEVGATRIHLLRVPVGRERAAAAAFARRAEVVFAETDAILAPQDVVPNDPWYVNEWHLKKIGCPTAWSTTKGSTGVVIAILDSGVDASHPDLADKIVAGWNAYNGNTDTRDVTGHGTAVAGTAAAATNNSAGVAAVAWNCKIMPVRVTDSTGYGSFAAIASGLTWAADHGARVANISFTASHSLSVQSAAQYFQSKGGVVVISAGNTGTVDNYADNPYALTVSATDPSDVLYSWSTRGPHVDISAPGAAYTTVRGGGYTTYSGTSISAPVVAGVAALVKSFNGALTGAQIQDILKRSARDLGAAGWDENYGWGRVDAAAALALAGGSAADTASPTVYIDSPAAGATVSGIITVQAAAVDNVGVSSVALYVDGTWKAADTSAPYSFPLDTTALSNASHTIKVVAKDAAGNAGSAQVSVTVSNGVADTLAPTIVITSPLPGAKVNGNVTVTVDARDNVGVARVELYVDGVLTGTAYGSPFSIAWSAKSASRGPHVLVCKAYDAAGNVGVSPSVSVTR